MHIEAAGLSDTGQERRDNEDRFLVDDDLGLYVVCDGMGGHANGALAAETAIGTIRATLHQQRDTLAAIAIGHADVERLASLAEYAIQEASRRVYALATSQADARGMGCTATLVIAAGRHAVMGHVGDSRLYVCRDGNVHRLSSDHTMADDLLARGLLAPEDVRDHPFASALTRSVGTHPVVQVDTLLLDVRPGDRFLLCSDGLHGYIDSHTWLADELADDDLEGVVEELVEFANRLGGHDNITALVMAIDEVVEPEPTRRVDVELSLKIDALEKVHLFRGLGLARLYHVLSAARLVRLEAGDVLFDAGQDFASMYIVAQGSVRANFAKRGGVRLGPGDHFGSTTLMRPRESRARVEAVVDTMLLEIQRVRFQHMVRKRPYLGLLLYERIGRRICGEVDRAGDALLDIRSAIQKVGPDASVTL